MTLSFDAAFPKSYNSEINLITVPDLELLELFSTDASETLLNPDDHNYFGHVAVNLIGFGIGTVTCKICGKIYDASQLKEFAVGHGKSPFDINPEQKGESSI